MGLFDKLKGKVKDAIEETKTSIRETVDNLRYDRLKEGLSRTREGITEKLASTPLQTRAAAMSCSLVRWADGRPFRLRQNTAAGKRAFVMIGKGTIPGRPQAAGKAN